MFNNDSNASPAGDDNQINSESAVSDSSVVRVAAAFPDLSASPVACDFSPPIGLTTACCGVEDGSYECAKRKLGAHANLDQVCAPASKTVTNASFASDISINFDQVGGAPPLECKNCNVEQVPLKPLVRLADPFGQEIVIYTAGFIISYVCHKVLPKMQLAVKHGYCLECTPLTCGVFIDVIGRDPFTDDDFVILKTAFYETLSKSLPIKCVVLDETETLRRFHEQGSVITYSLLRSTNMSPYYECYELDGYLTLRRRPLLPSTNLNQCGPIVEILQEKKGLLLRLEGWRPVPVSKSLDCAFERATQWARVTQMLSVGDINEMVLRDAAGLIRLEETRFDNEVMHCALTSLRDRPQLRVVLISGPSASGKTTFASKLALAFKSLGRKPLVMSTDDYYRDNTDPDYPKQPNGENDCEVVEALRLPLLREHLNALMHGQEIVAPLFDMVHGMPKEEGVALRLDEMGILLMEGIFALDPKVIEGLSRDGIFRIFISPMPFFFLDEQSFIETSVIRLIRRIARDYLHRGRDATASIVRLETVSRGEINAILSHIAGTDYFLNSALAHELSILKVIVAPLLSKVSSNSPAYERARQLVRLLEQVTPCSDSLLPNTSLLREFSGGSIWEERRVEIDSKQLIMQLSANRRLGIRLRPSGGQPALVRDALLQVLDEQLSRDHPGLRLRVDGSRLLAAVLNGESVPLSRPLLILDDSEEQYESLSLRNSLTLSFRASSGNVADLAAREAVHASEATRKMAMPGSEEEDMSNNTEDVTGMFAKPVFIGGPGSGEVMRATILFLLHVAVRQLWPTRRVIVCHGFGSEGKNHGKDGSAYFCRIYERCVATPETPPPSASRGSNNTRQNASGSSLQTSLTDIHATPSVPLDLSDTSSVELDVEPSISGSVPTSSCRCAAGARPLLPLEGDSCPVMLSAHDALQLTAAMDALVDRGSSITVKSLSGPSAVHYFRNAGMAYTVALIESRNLPTIDVVSSEREMALYFQPLAPSFKTISKTRYAVYPYGDGLALVVDYPDVTTPVNMYVPVFAVQKSPDRKRPEAAPESVEVSTAVISSSADTLESSSNKSSRSKSHQSKSHRKHRPCEEGGPRPTDSPHRRVSMATSIPAHQIVSTRVGIIDTRGNLQGPAGIMSPLSRPLRTNKAPETMSFALNSEDGSGVGGAGGGGITPTVASIGRSGSISNGISSMGAAENSVWRVSSLDSMPNSSRLFPRHKIVGARGPLQFNVSTFDNLVAHAGSPQRSPTASPSGQALANEDEIALARRAEANPRLRPPLCSAARMQIQESADNMRQATQVTCVGGMNKAVMMNDCVTVVQVSKAAFQRKIARIAASVQRRLALASANARSSGSRRDGSLVLLVAGPSSGGKGVLTELLALQLRISGAETRILSIDNYYKNIGEDNYPKTASGAWDYESVQAIRCDQLDKDAQSILSGKDTETPVFELGRGRRKDNEHITVKGLTRGGVLICEGLFALQDDILASVPKEQKWRIVVHPIPMLNIDELRFVSHRVLRILRRIARDYYSRRRDARDTLTRWNGVSEGEDRNIMPFLDKADIMLNASSIYEIGALKRVALPLLEEVSPMFEQEYERAVELRGLLQWFHDVPDVNAPLCSYHE